jgi:hypothetical protein
MEYSKIHLEKFTLECFLLYTVCNYRASTLRGILYLGISADFYDSEWLTKSMYLFITDFFCVHNFPLKLINSSKNAHVLESNHSMNIFLTSVKNNQINVIFFTRVLH